MITDFFQGKTFFEMAGYVWNDMMKFASGAMLKNPTNGIYTDTWADVANVYHVMNLLAGVLTTLFFLYGFCKECTDLHTEMTLDRTIKLFIRLVIVVNGVTYVFSWLPDFLKWASNLSRAILGTKKFGFYIDGEKIYENIESTPWGHITVFLTSFLFFLFAAVCGFLIVMAVLKRFLKIFLIAPFCSLAFSTLAAGGQLSQVGYSYIKTFIGYALEILIIALAIVLSTTFIQTVSIESDSSIIILVQYCIKMASITSAVKGTESIMQKAFSL